MSESKNDSSILVIALGGTIDSIERTWPKPTGPQEVTMLEKSLVGEFIESIKKDPSQIGLEKTPDLKFIQNEKFADSSKFTDTDLARLSVLIKEQGIKNVIITCGTDFMIPLAQKMQEIFKDDKDLTIQVTGAMTPLANGLKRNDEWDVTDGYDNLKYALKNALENKLEKGTHVVFKNRPFSPDDIKKDFQTAEFVTEKEYYSKYLRPVKFEGFTKYARDKATNEVKVITER